MRFVRKTCMGNRQVKKGQKQGETQPQSSDRLDQIITFYSKIIDANFIAVLNRQYAPKII